MSNKLVTLHSGKEGIALQNTYDILGIPNAHSVAIPEMAQKYVAALVEIHSTAFVASKDPVVAAEYGCDSDSFSPEEIKATITEALRQTLNIDVIAEAYKADAMHEAGEDYDTASMYTEALDVAVAETIPELVASVQKGTARHNEAHVQQSVDNLSLLGIRCAVVESEASGDVKVSVSRHRTSNTPAKIALGAVVAGVSVIATVSPAAAAQTSPTPSPTETSVSAEIAPVNGATVTPSTEQPTPVSTTASPSPTDTQSTGEPASSPTTPVPQPTSSQSSESEQPSPTPSATAIEIPVTSDPTPDFVKPTTPPIDPQSIETTPVFIEAPDTATSPKNLSAEIGGQYAHMKDALAKGTFNAYSPTEEQFNPEFGSKHLAVPLTEKAKTLLSQKILQFDRIISGDQDAINESLSNFDLNLDDQMKQELANFIQSDDFVKQGQPLTIEQRIAIMQVIQSTHESLEPEAKVAYAKALKAAESQSKPKPSHESKTHAPQKYSILIPKIHDEEKLAAAIDAYILEVAPDSPFVGQGKNFVKGGKKHGVDPLLAVVIAQMDSNVGTKGVAAHYNTNNPWNRDCPDGKPRVHYTDGRSGHNHSACTYDSPEQALLQDDYEGMEAARKGHDSIFAYIERKYINHGITTLEDFLAIYTPAAESSKAEHERLLKGYMRQYDKLYAMAGDAISFGIRLSTLNDLPDNPGSRHTTRAMAEATALGDTIYGPDDPCAQLQGNVRVLCAAKKFFNVRYGTADPGYAPKWSRIWGQTITSWGGHGPLGWILRNKKGSSNDFLECSGLIAVSYKAAYNADVDNCSAGFLHDKKNFIEIDPHDVRPGDLVIAARWCGGKQGGHVGFVESYNKTTGKLVTYEASAGMSSEGYARSGRITRHKIGKDFHYAVRYIGPGSDTDLQSRAAA